MHGYADQLGLLLIRQDRGNQCGAIVIGISLGQIIIVNTESFTVVTVEALKK